MARPRWADLPEPPLHVETVESVLDGDNSYPLYVRSRDLPKGISEVWVVTTNAVLELRYDHTHDQWEKDVHHSGNAAKTVRQAVTTTDSEWTHVQEYDALDTDVEIGDDLSSDTVDDLFG
jgi:hypothetical protein